MLKHCSKEFGRASPAVQISVQGLEHYTTTLPPQAHSKDLLNYRLIFLLFAPRICFAAVPLSWFSLQPLDLVAESSSFLFLFLFVASFLFHAPWICFAASSSARVSWQPVAINTRSYSLFFLFLCSVMRDMTRLCHPR